MINQIWKTKRMFVQVPASLWAHQNSWKHSGHSGTTWIPSAPLCLHEPDSWWFVLSGCCLQLMGYNQQKLGRTQWWLRAKVSNSSQRSGQDCFFAEQNKEGRRDAARNVHWAGRILAYLGLNVKQVNACSNFIMVCPHYQ